MDTSCIDLIIGGEGMQYMYNHKGVRQCLTPYYISISMIPP